MNLNQAFNDLQQLMADHFTPAPMELSLLPPAIHTFRHRSELFLRAGGLDDKGIEKLNLQRSLPVDIFLHVQNVYLHFTMQNTLPKNAVSKARKKSDWAV